MLGIQTLRRALSEHRQWQGSSALPPSRCDMMYVPWCEVMLAQMRRILVLYQLKDIPVRVKCKRHTLDELPYGLVVPFSGVFETQGRSNGVCTLTGTRFLEDSCPMRLKSRNTRRQVGHGESQLQNSAFRVLRSIGNRLFCMLF